MTDFTELRKTCGDDAEKWMQAFVDAYPNDMPGDLTLRDWFSAAIEGSHDVRAKRRAERGYPDE